MYKKASKPVISLRLKAFLPISLLTSLILSGCASSTGLLVEKNVDADQPIKAKQQQETTSNSDIFNQLDLDIALLREIGAEWRVRDPITHNKAVNLSVLLEIAKQQHLAGNNRETSRLITKISQLIALAIEQSTNNENALPIYPDQ